MKEVPILDPKTKQTLGFKEIFLLFNNEIVKAVIAVDDWVIEVKSIPTKNIRI